MNDPGEARTRLEQKLGTGLEDVLDRLSPEETETLYRLFQEARHTQMAALLAAAEDTLKVLPRPFRRTASKVLFGGGS